MFKKNTSRRKSLLIEDRGSRRKKGRKIRNNFLNTVSHWLLLKYIWKFFKGTGVWRVGIFLMFLFIVFAFFSPYFEIKKITTTRDNPNIDVEAVEAKLEGFYQKNLLFIQKEQIESILLADFPEFREVRVQEKWPNEIMLHITVSPEVFTIFNEETANFSVISQDGVILSQTLRENLPVLKIKNYENILKPRDQFIEKGHLEKIILGKTLLGAELGLEVEEMFLYPQAYEIHYLVLGETLLWIDLREDIGAQIKKLKLAQEEVKLFGGNNKYIDLRIRNQIFWFPN